MEKHLTVQARHSDISGLDVNASPASTANANDSSTDGYISSDNFDESALKVSYAYLLSMTLVLMLGCMNFGHGLAATNVIWPALVA